MLLSEKILIQIKICIFNMMQSSLAVVTHVVDGENSKAENDLTIRNFFSNKTIEAKLPK